MATRPPPTALSRDSVSAESLGALFRRLAEQGEALLRQEVELAKLELREATLEAARASLGLVLAVACAAMGALAVIAALIVLLAPALGSYWGSALVVAAALFLVAGVLGWRGVRRLRSTSIGASAAARSIKRDVDWAAREAGELADEVL